LISRMTVEGAAAFGFNHPILIVLVAINAIAVPARHISGEIESGTMELLLAYPVSRVRLLLSLWAMSALIGLVVVSAALLGSLSGVIVFDAATKSLVWRLSEIALNLWLITLVMQTVALLASAFGTRGARPALWSAVILLSLYVVHFLTPLWEALRYTAPVNIFTYYQPQKLVFGERSLAENAVVLIAVTAIALVLAARRFHTRDIPG
jgi:ABC-2 type transport system permease protein